MEEKWPGLRPRRLLGIGSTPTVTSLNSSGGIYIELPVCSIVGVAIIFLSYFFWVFCFFNKVLLTHIKKLGKYTT